MSKSLGEANYEVLSSLFMTITNANFDDGSIEKQIMKMIAVRDKLQKFNASCGFYIMTRRPSQLVQENPCWKRGYRRRAVKRGRASLRQMITYGLRA